MPDESAANGTITVCPLLIARLKTPQFQIVELRLMVFYELIAL